MKTPTATVGELRRALADVPGDLPVTALFVETEDKGRVVAIVIDIEFKHEACIVVRDVEFAGEFNG